MSAALLFEALALLPSIPSATMPPAHRWVWVYLANRADDGGVAWPAVDTISASTGHSASTVDTILSDLRTHGWIDGPPRWEGKVRLTTRYTVRLDGRPIVRGAGVTRRSGRVTRPSGHPPDPAIGLRVTRPSGQGDPAIGEDPIRDPIMGSDKDCAPVVSTLATEPAPVTARAATSTLIDLGAPAAAPKATKGSAADRIFAEYITARTASGAKGKTPELSPEHRKLVAARLREFEEYDLVLAARGIWLDQWRIAHKRTAFKYAMKNAENVESFRDTAAEHAPIADTADLDTAREWVRHHPDHALTATLRREGRAPTHTEYATMLATPTTEGTTHGGRKAPPPGPLAFTTMST